MGVLAGTLGVIVVGAAMLDVVWSTLSTSGGGFLTRKMSHWLWQLALVVHRRVNSQRLLEASAPAIVLAVVGIWILLLWCGWTLIFSASPEAVIDATHRLPATLSDRIYFVGSTLFTLGIGDFVPGMPRWRVLTALASINGLFTVTLAITYVIPVVSAATAKRQLALFIHSLGDTASAIVANGWNGRDFAGLEPQLAQIAPMLLLHSERHLVYPVLHYFHPVESEAVLSTKIVALDDAVTLLTHCVREDVRPAENVLRALRYAQDVFLRRVQHHFATRRDEVPGVPGLDSVRAAGVPLLEPTNLHRVFEDASERREWLSGLLYSDGWNPPNSDPTR